MIISENPVSYFCNNLFLTDWDMSCMEKIEFNDLYEFLYAKETGKRPLLRSVTSWA